MGCHICGKEAVDRCFACGKLFCALHGDKNCSQCDSAIAPGEPWPNRISASRLRRSDDKSPWWRPQQAEDVEMPACHECKGLARTRCKNCEQYYCGDHAGPNGLCQDCGRSSLLGVIFLFIALGLMAVMILWAVLFER